MLVLLIIKYASDKYAGQPYAPITIPPGAGFKEMIALQGKSDIGDQINKRIVAPLAAAIDGHPEFAAFIDGMNDHFARWRKKAAKKLKELATGCHPKEVIASLADGLLAHYQDQPLIDPYDVYQHLMDYWAATMQDDCYAIAADGWQAEPARFVETDKKGKQKDRGWVSDLVPKSLIVARYFAKDQAAIETLVAKLESVSGELAAIEEEHGGEEGLLAELEKVNKANVATRLKEIKGDKEAKEEAAVLNEWLKLNTKSADRKKQIKDAEAALDTKGNTSGSFSTLFTKRSTL